MDDYRRDMEFQRIIGEMAGCLEVFLIMCDCDDIRKDGVRDLLIRYRKLFERGEGK